MTLKRPRRGRSPEHGDPPAQPLREHGYTLVELMVAALVLVIGMAGAFALLNGANRTTVTNNARMGATNLARERRGRALDRLRQAHPDGHDPRAAGQGGDVGRGVAVDVRCAAASSTRSPPRSAPSTTRRTTSRRCRPPTSARRRRPCPPRAGALEPEIQPDDFRRVTVTVAWNTGRGPDVKQVALVNNPPAASARASRRSTRRDLNNQFGPRPATSPRSRRSRRPPPPCAGTPTAPPTAPATRPAAR